MEFSKDRLKLQNKNIDYPLLIVVGILVIFGLIMVYDASVIQALKDFKDGTYYIRQQLIWVLIGLFSMFFFSSFDYKKFKSLAFPMLGFSLILLLAVFIPGLGVSGGGAHRWLRLGPLTLQPAEIIKLTSVIFLASIFEKKVRLMPFIVLVGIVTFITAVLQKDLGSAIVFVAISTVLYFVSYGPLWHFLAAIPFMVGGLLVLIFTSGYRSKRIAAFLDPFSDPQGFTYHISQVLIALGS